MKEDIKNESPKKQNKKKQKSHPQELKMEEKRAEGQEKSPQYPHFIKKEDKWHGLQLMNKKQKFKGIVLSYKISKNQKKN